MKAQGTRTFQQKQRGAVLIVALLILLVLTMLGVMGLSNMTLEERMAAGYQHMEMAFDASQSTINTAIFNSTQFQETATGKLDCSVANNCTTLYNAAIDPTSVLAKGLGDTRNIPLDADNCYFNFKDPQITGTGSTALSNASLNADVWVTTAGTPDSPEDMPGYEAGSGTFAPQRFDITSETKYQSASVTTAVSSQTQRIIKVVPSPGVASSCPEPPALSDRTYPIR